MTLEPDIHIFMKAFGKGLLIFIIIESSLGDGGRLFDIGLISPHMVLFGVGVAHYSVAFFCGMNKYHASLFI